MRSPLVIISCLVASAAIGRTAWAQGTAPAPADPAAGTTTAPPAPAEPSATPGGSDEPTFPPDKARWGAGLRLRYVFIPKWELELFVAKAATNVSGVGFGVEGYRRKGNFELQLGLEYEGLSGSEGIWIDKGETLTSEGPDKVRFDSFGWFTIEATFINHTPFNKYVALRYGGGAGLGILKGSVRRTDMVCSTMMESSCRQDPAAENIDKPYDLPPVFPVLNGILGVQVTPVKNLVINVEGIIRTTFFFGLTVGYFFK